MYISSIILQLINNVKILHYVSGSVIFWKIQSCNKKFLFPKRLVDLFDVGKVVPNKGEPYHIWGLPEELMTGLQKHLIPDHSNYWNEIKFPVNKISDKFATSFAEVR